MLNAINRCGEHCCQAPVPLLILLAQPRTQQVFQHLHRRRCRERRLGNRSGRASHPSRSLRPRLTTVPQSVTNDLHLWSTEMQAPSYPVIGNQFVLSSTRALLANAATLEATFHPSTRSRETRVRWLRPRSGCLIWRSGIGRSGLGARRPGRWRARADAMPSCIRGRTSRLSRSILSTGESSFAVRVGRVELMPSSRYKQNCASGARRC